MKQVLLSLPKPGIKIKAGPTSPAFCTLPLVAQSNQSALRGCNAFINDLLTIKRTWVAIAIAMRGLIG